MKTRQLACRRFGLTLIELMATLVLLSVLLAVLSGLVPAFAKKTVQHQASNESLSREAFQAVAERVAADLINAESASVEGGCLTMTGWFGRNEKTGRATDRIHHCQYCIAGGEEDSMLLIRHRGDKRELLLYGSFDLVIETIEPQADRSRFELTLTRHGLSSATQSLPLSSSLCVSIRSANGERIASAPAIEQRSMER